MDKMYYLSNRANDTNFWLALDFDNLDLFQPMQESSMTGIDVKMSEVYGDKVDFERYFYVLIVSFLVFGSNWLFFFSDDSDVYAVTAWALSLVPEIHADKCEQLTGEIQEKIETVFVNLHTPALINHNVCNESDLMIINHFWKEFKHFLQ